jgi:hypothetical protein
MLITSNICVNRMATWLEGNVGEQAQGWIVTVYGMHEDGSTRGHSSIRCGAILDPIPDIPSRALKRRQNSWSSSSSLGCLDRSCGCLAALLYSSCFDTSPILSRNVSRPNRFSTSCRSLSWIQWSSSNFKPLCHLWHFKLSPGRHHSSFIEVFCPILNMKIPGTEMQCFTSLVPLSSKTYSNHAY